MSKKNKKIRKAQGKIVNESEVNILEVNKSCFKDCFYSFSHEHTRGYTHLFFLIPPTARFPPPPQIPPLVSVEHCLSFALSFVISSLNFFFSFLSLVSCPAPPSPTFSSIFFFIFSSFQFFYQSVAHGPFRRRDHPIPTRWKLTSFCFGWADQQCSHHREKGLTNTRSRSFLSGSSFKYMCVCVKRGGTAAAERSRFFKYDIKKAEEEEKLLFISA